MKAMVCFSLLGALACAMPSASADTNVGGPILTHTTWNLAGSPYIVTSSIIVGNGATLTIEPGVEVRFNATLGLQVGYASFPPSGKLVARGNAGAPILFTSNTTQQPGAWARVYFTDYAVDAVYDGQGNYVSGSILEYVTVEYAGAGTNVAAVTVQNSSACLSHVRVHDSRYCGIAIVTDNAPSQRIRNCEIWNINEGASWAALYLSGSAGGHLINGNYVHDCAAGGMVLDPSCSVTGNTITGCAGYYGGVYVGGASTTLTGNTITGNTAPNLGGGAFVNGSNCTVTGNTITGNTANNGGGVAVYDPNCTLAENTITGNTANNGGGVAVYDPNCTLTGNTITGNTATQYGGGVYVVYYAPNCTLTGNTITGNTANSSAGGVYVEGSNCTLTGNLIMNNGAGNGGAIWFQAQTTTMSRCVVAGNHSTTPGGGAIYIGAYLINLAGDPNSGAYNTICCNDATYQIYNNIPFNPNGSNDIHAEYVRWGTNDPQDLLDWIYDYFDDANKSIVLWYPLVAYVPGDMNCDGVVDFDDINPFVLALGGFDGYFGAYPDCNWYHADCDDNCTVDFDDINPFVALLSQ